MSLKQFNKNDTLLVITSFPNPTNGRLGKRELNAVGWHSENVLGTLSKNRKVLVTAEDNGETRKHFKVNENLLIKRIWQKGKPLSLFALTQFILKQNEIKSILVQFEFNLLGGTLPNLVFLALLAILKLSGKKITFEAHQVLTDISKLERHINITNPYVQFIYNAGLRIFYTALGLISDEIIVFEEELKERLKNFVPSRKINVLCLPVDRKNTVSKRRARKLLGLSANEFILLQFGFINGYKGIDWALAALRDQDSELRLLIAGGQNPYLKDKPFYQKFYNSILREISSHTNVTYSDFVPDNKINLYFSAADLVILPYTACMSASGPLSHALAFGKPFIISERLGDYLKSDDIRLAQENSKIEKADFVFDLKQEDFLKMITRAKRNKKYFRTLTHFSKSLALMRDIKHVTKNLDTLLFANLTRAKAPKFFPSFIFKPSI